MSWTSQQAIEAQRRLARGRKQPPAPEVTEGCANEVSDLHYPILEWCRKQMPMVPCIHGRTDRASSVTIGAPDFLICYRGRALLIECKNRKGKLRPEQAVWKHLAETQGFTVFVIRSMAEFMAVIDGRTAPF